MKRGIKLRRLGVHLFIPSFAERRNTGTRRAYEGARIDRGRVGCRRVSRGRVRRAVTATLREHRGVEIEGGAESDH
jgi:hypothetical protein